MSLGGSNAGGLLGGSATGAWLYQANPTLTDFTAIAGIFSGGSRYVQVADGAALTADVPLDQPDNSTWTGPQGGTVTNGVANSPPGPTRCPFHRDAPTAINSGTVTTSITPASPSNVVHISATNAPTAGNYGEISDGVSAWMGKIKSPTGSGSPWVGTIALTQAEGAAYTVPLPMRSASTVFAEYTSRPEGVTRDGRNCLFTGATVADQVVEDVRSRRMVTKNIRAICPAGQSGFGYDVCSSESSFENLHVELLGTTAEVGWYTQSGDRVKVTDCVVFKGPVGGEVLDGFDVEVTGCWFHGQSGYGGVVGSLPLSAGNGSLGSYNTRVSGGGAVGCAVGSYTFGARDTRWEGFVAEDCTTYGFLVGTSTDCINASGTFFGDCVARNCAVGWLINANVTNTVLEGCNAGGDNSDGCTVTALSAAGNVRVHDFWATLASGASYGMIFTCALAEISKITLTLPSGAWAVQASGTLLIIDGATLTTVNQIGVYVTSGTVRLFKVTTVGQASSTGLYVSAACSAFIGPGCNLAGSAKGIVAADGTATITAAPFGGASSVALSSGVTKVLSWAQYAVGVVKFTGALGADTTAAFPPIQGVIWTVNNATTGGKNVVAGVSLNETSTTTGTTINCAAGITRVYFDGTNMVQA